MSAGSKHQQHFGVDAHLSLDEPQRPLQWGHSPSQQHFETAHQRLYENTHPKDAYTVNFGEAPREEDGRHYYTEYSQVSAIETGFKKLKSNQIEILKELKREYEVLKNSSIESKVYPKGKEASESDSNIGEQSEGRESSNRDRDTHKSRAKKEGLGGSREYQMLQLEKKQLEIIINNSMKKIEELLHNEIELKRTVHELRSKVEGQGSSDGEYQFILRKMKKNEEELGETVENYKKEVEKLKAVVKQLNENMAHLEGTLAVKEVEVRKLQEERRLLEDSVRGEKNKYMLLEIDLKKAQMEYEILQKDKNSEIDRMQRNGEKGPDIQGKEQQATIRRLQEEIELKDKRYRILAEEIERVSEERGRGEKQRESTARQDLEKGREHIEEVLRKLAEEKSGGSSQLIESINLILQKMNELHRRPEEDIKRELDGLKSEL